MSILVSHLFSKTVFGFQYIRVTKQTIFSQSIKTSPSSTLCVVF